MTLVTTTLILILSSSLVLQVSGSAFKLVDLQLGASSAERLNSAISSAKEASDMESFVKILHKKLIYNVLPDGYFSVIFDLGQKHAKSLEESFFKKVQFNDRMFGVWIFKCGWFENKGQLGFTNWAYGSALKTCFEPQQSDGKWIKFYNSDCENLALKRKSC